MERFENTTFYPNLANILNKLHSLTDTSLKEDIINWFNSYVSIKAKDLSNHQTQKLPKIFLKGQIILVELGENIGNEFSGKHYCLVMRYTPKCSKTVFVLPLTSKKPKGYKPDDGIYIKIPKIKGLSGDVHWANILNLRNVSRDRIYFPTNIPRMNNNNTIKKINTTIKNQIIEQY